MLKIKKKNNDTVLSVAKAELKRLGNVYTENIASQIKLSDISPDLLGDSSEINWEEMANKVNSFKIRPLREKLSLKERPRKLLNSSKRRSFKIRPKEEKKEQDRLSTLEICTQDENTKEVNPPEENQISRELDLMLIESKQTPIINHPTSIESNSAHIVFEKKK